MLDDAVEYVKKSKLEVSFLMLWGEIVIEIISKNPHTGNAGGYKVDDVVRIRSGERGEAAI